MAGKDLVLCVTTAAVLAVPEALGCLDAEGLVVVKDVVPGEEDRVVAVVLGLGHFGPKEAARFPRLKLVARFGAGYENVDVEGLWREGGITVANTPNISNRDVAELALAMLILTLRLAPRDIRAMAAVPSAWRVVGRGLSLCESVIGIVGGGHIGMETARILAPLASRVLIWNRSRRALPVDLDPARCAFVDSMDDLAAEADAISVHLSLSEGTRGFVAGDFFDRVAAHGRRIALVNTARGGIVDEAALLAALDAGTVAAAALDVWSTEGAAVSPAVEALRAHPAVLPSSHLGAFTMNVQRNYAIQSARSIAAVLRGRPEDVADYIVRPKTR